MRHFISPKFRSFSLDLLKRMKTQYYVLKNDFRGVPKITDYELVEEELPALKDGEFLAKAEYISVDPYMRAFAKATGELVTGEQVAKILESKNPKYPVGQYVSAEFGWRTYSIGDDKPGDFHERAPLLLPDIGDLPKSLFLGYLGMPGHTSYFGFLEICKPKPGETVVVSAAAGAVGSHVGQIAKIKGCKVVGIAGSDEKGKWLTDELGFDAFVNYKDPEFEKKLAQATPNRIDCYFDNVGGQISSDVLYRMNKFGRVSICGAISNYNNSEEEEEEVKATEVQTAVKIYHLRMEGFHVYRWRDRLEESLDANLKWIKEGKLKYRETVYEGFENTPTAFFGLFSGNNTGKAIVKV